MQDGKIGVLMSALKFQNIEKNISKHNLILSIICGKKCSFNIVESSNWFK